MEEKNFNKLSDEELMIEKKKLMKTKMFFAAALGFLGGILIFGLVAWALGPKTNFGFLIALVIPMIFIYRMLKSPNKNTDLETVLKKRGLM